MGVARDLGQLRPEPSSLQRIACGANDAQWKERVVGPDPDGDRSFPCGSFDEREARLRQCSEPCSNTISGGEPAFFADSGTSK